MEYRLSERDGMLRATRQAGNIPALGAERVDVVIGITRGPYEPQGTKTTAMTKDARGLWTATFALRTTTAFVAICTD